MKRITAILICIFSGGTVANAEKYSVETFGYPSQANPGTTTTFSVGRGIAASSAAMDFIHQIDPSVADIELYCAGSPGPRFMQIDGIFYTLNGKSKRDGAFVETSGGDFEVTDSTIKPPSYLEDTQILLKLIDEAESAC